MSLDAAGNAAEIKDKVTEFSQQSRRQNDQELNKEIYKK
ncbi:hypothetical protein BH20ACI2_BH20ACI2_07300 [soil metagenome]